VAQGGGLLSRVHELEGDPGGLPGQANALGMVMSTRGGRLRDLAHKWPVGLSAGGCAQPTNCKEHHEWQWKRIIASIQWGLSEALHNAWHWCVGSPSC